MEGFWFVLASSSEAETECPLRPLWLVAPLMPACLDAINKIAEGAGLLVEKPSSRVKAFLAHQQGLGPVIGGVCL